MTSVHNSAADGLDMSQFHRVFFEETDEHLGTMEGLLLAIDPATAGDDELNAIFRAAHSIKGGSGTFGFTDMTGVTHELESLLDKARRREIALTTEMIDALLAAGDVLKLQLARHRGEPDVAEPQAAEVCERIKRFVSGAARAAAAPGTARTLVLRFPLAGDHGFPEALLAELGRHGRVETQDHAAGNWEVRLHTDAAEPALREAFAFFVNPADLGIAPVATEAADPGYGLFSETPAPASDPGYGFFDDADQATDATTTPGPQADPGYGFFMDQPDAGTADKPAPAGTAPACGRRSTDAPRVEGARAGRRDNDKIVVSAQGDQASIRVGVEKVDQLINQVGELVITQAMLAQSVETLDPLAYQALLAGMSDLARNTRDLQESVMSIRMMPIGSVFNRFPRMARDLAAKLGKQVSLVLEGEGTELDKGLIEKISDPLTHLVRNSIDHGIEPAEKRAAAGKPATGTVTLRASHQGGSIVIEVCDDGAGLSRGRILAKARERGLAVHDAMSDQEVWQLIFEAGFSTAERITDVSGRGVGMDVVKRNIAALGGSVEIESADGMGTRMMVRLPLTLAIIDGMSIAVGGDVYIIPLAAVVESLQAGACEVRSVAGGGRVVEVRNEYLPVIALRELFPGAAGASDESRAIMLIVESKGVKNALLVDALLGQQQVVVKSLETNYRKVPGVSGATIMGDGRVALILDVPAVVRMTRH
jgi:two-component system chemotaxis sensor kinase CheA